VYVLTFVDHQRTFENLDISTTGGKTLTKKRSVGRTFIIASHSLIFRTVVRAYDRATRKL
jgi:hypothetical protein